MNYVSTSIAWSYCVKSNATPRVTAALIILTIKTMMIPLVIIMETITAGQRSPVTATMNRIKNEI